MNTPIAEAAWIAVTLDRLFAPLRALVDNPLAEGHFCGECGTRLDKADRPCPFGCTRATRLREVQRVAVGKVGGDVRFLGAAVVLALGANA